MRFDFRLACLLSAISESWSDLDAREENGALVVRLREGVQIWEGPKP